MKRLLLIAPLVLLLLLLNACGGDTSAIPDAHWTAMAQTLTAQAWTAVPTPTFDPNIANMVNWLNADLLNANALGSTMDAQYSVNNIKFTPNSPELTFRIDVGCACMNDTDCCTPERTFVAIVETMKKFNTSFPPIPMGVTQMMVVCFDQKTKSQIGAVSASWQSINSYLWGNLDGHQLGVQITRTIAP